MAADSSPLLGLDLQQLAQAEYGPAARVELLGPGLFDWKVNLNGQHLNLDANGTFQRLNGQQWLVVATGVSSGDWKAVDSTLLASSYYTVPVIIIPEELRTDVAAVAGAVQAVTRTLENMQDFYRHFAGRTFQFIPPLLQLSHFTSAQINTTAQSGDSHLLDLAKGELNRGITLGQLLSPSLTPTVTVMIFFKTTGVAATGIGGRGDGGKVATLPPLVVEAPVLDWRAMAKGSTEDGTAFVVFHEGGHALGMPHTCDPVGPAGHAACIAVPANARSVMRGDVQNFPARDGADLGPADVDVIVHNPRFR